MTTFLTVIGILLLLFLIDFVMYKFFKASGILRFLNLAGLILILLGVYSLPYIAISGTAILITLGIILIASFLIFLLAKFITPGVVKTLIVLSVVLLLFSIFLVSFSTFKSDNENKKLIVKKTTTNKLFNLNKKPDFNTAHTIKELDSITANENKNFTFAKDISPSDLPAINRRNRIGS